MPALLTAAALLLLLSPPLSAADPSLIPRIEHAVVVSSAGQLEQFRQSLASEIGRASDADRKQALYTLAYVDWRLWPLYLSDTRKQTDALADAESHLKDLLKIDSANPEAQALRAHCIVAEAEGGSVRRRVVCEQAAQRQHAS